MAKFDDLYPEALEGFISQKHDKLPVVMKLAPRDLHDGEGEHCCSSCGALTDWVNPTATKYICSTECNQKLWETLLSIYVAQQITGAF